MLFDFFVAVAISKPVMFALISRRVKKCQTNGKPLYVVFIAVFFFSFYWPWRDVVMDGRCRCT